MKLNLTYDSIGSQEEFKFGSSINKKYTDQSSDQRQSFVTQGSFRAKKQKKQTCCQKLRECQFEFTVFNNYFRKDSGQKGIKWLWIIQLILVIFHSLYFILSLWIENVDYKDDNNIDENDKDQNKSIFSIFLIITLVMLISGNYYFFYNSSKNYMLSELKIFAITFTVQNAYANLNFALSWGYLAKEKQCYLFKLCENPIDNDKLRILQTIQFCFNVAGIFSLVPILILTYLIIFALYSEMRENLYLMLEGNRILYKQFNDITLAKGVIKLDFLANIVYFTSFIYIILWDYKDQKFIDQEFITKKDAIIFFICFFAFNMITQFIGSRFALSSTKKWKYYTYFVLRSISSVIKLVLTVYIIVIDEQLRTTFHKTDKNGYNHMCFFILTIFNGLFLFLTFVYSTMLIYAGMNNRKFNQSSGIRAMWRVEESHFRPELNINGINTQKSKKQKTIQKRIMDVLQ